MDEKNTENKEESTVGKDSKAAEPGSQEPSSDKEETKKALEEKKPDETAGKSPENNQNSEQAPSAEHAAEKTKESPSDTKDSASKDRIFYYAVVALVIALILTFTLPQFISPKAPISLDELHQKNLDGKLSPDKGYIYKGLYSFVYFDGLWHTQLKTPQATKLFNMKFHYSPRDVEHLTPVGSLNLSLFDKYRNFFITFDPTDEELSYIGVAVGETDFPLVNVFNKGVIGSCTNNESEACIGRPIVDCNSTDAPVFYFASEDQTNVIYMDNCIILTGHKEELFKATDRMLYDLLGIMS